MSVSAPPRPAEAPREYAARRPVFAWRPGRADREVLWLYLLTRVGLWTTAGAVRWLFPSDGQAREPAAFLSPWQQWDWWHYLHIARDGYFPGGAGPWTAGWTTGRPSSPASPSPCAPCTRSSRTGPRPEP